MVTLKLTLVASLPLICSAYKFVEPTVVASSTSVKGHTTYRLAVKLKAPADTLYTIFGTARGALSIPPSYNVPSPFGQNIGGVQAEFFKFKKEAEWDSWLSVGVTGGDAGNVLGSAGLTANMWKQWSEKRGHGIVSHDCGVFWIQPKKSICKRGPQAWVVAQLTLQTGVMTTAAMGMSGYSEFGYAWREDQVEFKLGGQGPAPPPFIFPPGDHNHKPGEVNSGGAKLEDCDTLYKKCKARNVLKRQKPPSPPPPPPSSHKPSASPPVSGLPRPTESTGCETCEQCCI